MLDLVLVPITGLAEGKAVEWVRLCWVCEWPNLVYIQHDEVSFPGFVTCGMCRCYQPKERQAQAQKALLAPPHCLIVVRKVPDPWLASFAVAIQMFGSFRHTPQHLCFACASQAGGGVAAAARWWHQMLLEGNREGKQNGYLSGSCLPIM
jgi:hypothetical protein